MCVEGREAELAGAEHPTASPAVSRRLASASQPSARSGPVGARRYDAASASQSDASPAARADRTRLARPAPTRRACGSWGARASRIPATTRSARRRRGAGGAPGAVPGGDREEVGLQPMDVPGLCAQQRRALVGGRHGTVPVVRGQCRTGNRHQEVRLLARLQRSGDESGLDDGEGVLGEPTAVAEVLGTLSVEVAVMCTRSSPMPNSSAATCATFWNRPWPISVPP